MVADSNRQFPSSFGVCISSSSSITCTVRCVTGLRKMVVNSAPVFQCAASASAGNRTSITFSNPAASTDSFGVLHWPRWDARSQLLALSATPLHLCNHHQHHPNHLHLHSHPHLVQGSVLTARYSLIRNLLNHPRPLFPTLFPLNQCPPLLPFLSFPFPLWQRSLLTLLPYLCVDCKLCKDVMYNAHQHHHHQAIKFFSFLC